MILILNYIIWCYDALTYDKRISNMNIDDIQKDMAYDLKPIVLIICLIPYTSLVNLIVYPIVKKYFNI
jgi:hypothetical protein